MAYNLKIGNKATKDTFYTIAPINRLLRIFAKSNVKKLNNEVVQCWSLTETLSVLAVLCTITAFFLFFKIQNLQNSQNNELKFSDSIQFIFIIGFVEYLLDLIYVFKMRQKCVLYIKFYAQIDKMLTVPNFSEMRMKILVTVAFFMTAFGISSVFDYYAWFDIFGWMAPTLYSLDYLYVLISTLTAFDMMTNVIQVEYRVKVMVDLIEEYALIMPLNEGLTLDEDFPERRDAVENNEATNIRRVDKLDTVSSSKNMRLFSLSKYYLLLIEQVNYINTAYGFRIAAFCMNTLIYITHITNILLRLMLKRYLPDHSILPELSSGVRILNYSSAVVVLVYRCGQTYRCCARAVHSIDLAVVTRDIPSELKASLLDLRALILSRPVKFHGAEFFTIDYPLLVSLASVVISHTIILLQSLK